MVTKVIEGHPVLYFGNIVWNVKNVFLKDGIALKRNVIVMTNIFIANIHKNVYPSNGVVMEPFNVPLQQKMNHSNFVRLNRHFHKEPQSNVQRA